MGASFALPPYLKNSELSIDFGGEKAYFRFKKENSDELELGW